MYKRQLVEPSKRKEAGHSIDNIGGSKTDQPNCNSTSSGIEAKEIWLITSPNITLVLIMSDSDLHTHTKQTHPPHCKGVSNHQKHPMRVREACESIPSISPIHHTKILKHHSLMPVETRGSLVNTIPVEVRGSLQQQQRGEDFYCMLSPMSRYPQQETSLES